MAGVWDVSIIENRLSAKRLLGWEAYFNLEPRGEERADHRAALIAATVFNMAVDVKDRKPYTDFLLKFVEREKHEKKQPTKEQLAQKHFEMLSIWARAHEGVEVVEDTAGDKLMQQKMREQVAQARAAMKGT